MGVYRSREERSKMGNLLGRRPINPHLHPKRLHCPCKECREYRRRKQNNLPLVVRTIQPHPRPRYNYCSCTDCKEYRRRRYLGLPLYHAYNKQHSDWSCQSYEDLLLRQKHHLAPRKPYNVRYGRTKSRKTALAAAGVRRFQALHRLRK